MTAVPTPLLYMGLIVFAIVTLYALLITRLGIRVERKALQLHWENEKLRAMINATPLHERKRHE